MPESPGERALRVTLGEAASRAQLETLNAGRETVRKSSTSWRRVTDGSPCGFCAMLVTRGPVYTSSRKAGSLRKYHTHCGCTVEPFEGPFSEWEPTPDEQRFIDAYEEVHRGGMTGDEVARLMDDLLRAPDDAVRTFAEAAKSVTTPRFNTLAEAEQYLSKFAPARGIKLRGVSVAHANEIAEAMDRLYTAMPSLSKLSSIEALPSTTKLGKKVFSGDQAMAAYEFIYDRLFLNTTILKNASTLAAQKSELLDAIDYLRKNYSRLSATQRATVDFYTAAGRSLVDGETIAGVITHEFGHKVHSIILKADRPLANALAARMDEFAVKVSGYAGSDVREYFAESFAAFVKGETGRIDPQMLAYFQSLLA